jgi:N-acetylglutamate synthase
MLDLDRDDLLRRAHANFAETWRLYARGTGSGVIHEEDGVLCIITGIPIPYFNPTIVTRLPDNPASAVERIRDFYLASDQRPVINVTGSAAAVMEPLFRAAGFVFDEDEPVMILDPDDAREPRMPAGLTFDVVRDPEQLRAFNVAAAAGFEVPPGLLDPFDDPHQLELPDFTNYAGFLDGKLVATAALMATHRMAGVNTISTLPEYRGRGIGAAMTWRAIQDGFAAGCIAACLHASHLGYRVYERLGFRHVADYRVWRME